MNEPIDEVTFPCIHNIRLEPSSRYVERHKDVGTELHIRWSVPTGWILVGCQSLAGDHQPPCISRYGTLHLFLVCLIFLRFRYSGKAKQIDDDDDDVYSHIH